MKNIFFLGIALFLFLLTLNLYDNPCFGKIYKYKNENGNWVYTNKPSTVPKEDLQAQLSESFPPKNEIEKARNATVLIENLKSGGFGSGFFITNDGYILTNKHLVQDKDGIFNIYLIDKTKFKIYGAKISYKYDLALLKLKGYKCPLIQPIHPGQLAGGQFLYAIGMPKGLMHSISSGIYSGFRRFKGIPYIQTNAQINEGNSGGPLITEDGKVTGINTWKIVGLDTEGLGFAIPIKTALDEFKSFLGQRYTFE